MFEEGSKPPTRPHSCLRARRESGWRRRRPDQAWPTFATPRIPAA